MHICVQNCDQFCTPVQKKNFVFILYVIIFVTF